MTRNVSLCLVFAFFLGPPSASAADQWTLIEAEDSSACTVQGGSYIDVFPRSTGQQIVALHPGSRLRTEGRGTAVYLRLPLVFTTPGPWYGSSIGSQATVSIDDGDPITIDIATSPREVLVADGLQPGLHEVVVVAQSGFRIDGFRFSDGRLSEVTGTFVSWGHQETLVDVRADVFQEGMLVRTDYVRSPHNGRFQIIGLAPGAYTLVLEAAGWDTVHVGVTIEEPGQQVDLGVLAPSRSERADPYHWGDGPGFGKSITVQPGGSFTAELSLYDFPIERVELVSRYRSIPVEIVELERSAYGKYSPYARIKAAVSKDTPFDMYDLAITPEGGRRASTWPRAVRVSRELPETFHLAAVGHVNTWGQVGAEYLRKMAETAQLAGARVFLVANGVNPAYISGGLVDLRIPYVTTWGNHSMARWDDFYGPRSLAVDDGPLRIVTFGDWPFRSWAVASELLQERSNATCRVLTSFESFPGDALIKDGKVDLMIDAHTEPGDSLAPKPPPGTMHFRTYGITYVSWLQMDHEGVHKIGDKWSDPQILKIPREGPIPLRVAFDGPNDGSRHHMEATITNDYETGFPAVSLRFELARGRYGLKGAEMVQQFDADGSEKTIVDVSLPVEAESVVTVRLDPI